MGAIEVELTPDGKGTGTVLPACKLTVNKKKQQVEIETIKSDHVMPSRTVLRAA